MMDVEIQKLIDQGRKDFFDQEKEIEKIVFEGYWQKALGYLDNIESIRTGSYCLDSSFISDLESLSNPALLLIGIFYRGERLDRISHTKESLTAFKDALDFATEFGFENFEPILRIRVAEQLLKLNSIDIAKFFLLKLEDQITTLGAKRREPHTLEQSLEYAPLNLVRARLELLLGQNDKVEEHIKKALSWYEASNDWKGTVRSMLRLSKFMYDSNRKEYALEKVKAAYLMAEKHQLEAEKAMALAFKGRFYLYSNQYDEAQLCFEKEFKINQELNDYPRLLDSLNSLGDLYRLRGFFDEAEGYYSQALELAQKIEDKPRMAKCNNNLGNMYYKKGRLDQSQYCFQAAYDIDAQMNNHFGEALAANNLAMNYKAKGDYTSALKFVAISLSIKDEINDKFGQAISWTNLGDIHRLNGDFEEARSFYHKAMDFFRSRNVENYIAMIHSNLGHLLWAEQNLVAATDQYRSALKLDQKLGNQQGLSFSYFNLGRIYLANQDFDLATVYFNKRLGLGKGIGDIIAESKALEGLALTSLLSGNIFQAEEILKEIKTIRARYKEIRGERVLMTLKCAIAIELKHFDEALEILDNMNEEICSYMPTSNNFVVEETKAIINFWKGDPKTALRAAEKVCELPYLNDEMKCFASASKAIFELSLEESFEKKMSICSDYIIDAIDKPQLFSLAFFFLKKAVILLDRDMKDEAENELRSAKKLLTRMKADEFRDDLFELIDNAGESSKDLSKKMDSIFFKFLHWSNLIYRTW